MTIPKPFTERYIPEPMSGCWLWLDAVTSSGHGCLRIGGKAYGAHVISYLTHKGSVPSGLVVRHACDTPSCVNPDHLELGTKGDNNRDTVRRGRWANGYTRVAR